MKILLLQAMSEVQNNFVPLGLAYIGAAFERNNCEVRILDASAPYASYETQDLLGEIGDFQPDMIGLTLTVTYAAHSYRLIRQISASTEAPIVVGGPHATILPHEPLQHGANMVVRGEGERTCLDLVKYLRGDMGLSEIMGISYMGRNGGIVDNPPRARIEDLDSVPFPAKHFFRKTDFVRSPADLIRYSNIMTSRGCPGMCTYCANNAMWGRRVRWRSAHSVLSEMKALRDAYGLRRFQFLDDAFTSVRKRIQDLCDGILADFPGARWSCVTRVDFMDQELLKEMARAGCEHINYGLESGDTETLSRIKKGITPDQAERVLRWTRESGITAGVNFMHGFPWDTPQSMERTRNFIRRVSPLVRDIMPGGILIPYPGTNIYEEYKDAHRFENWWLKERLLTGRELRLSPPLFEKMFFYYDTLGYDYFHYPKSMTREIKKTARLVGRHNLLFYARQISRWPFHYLAREMIFALVMTSRTLHGISPNLERAVMRPFLTVASRKEAHIRSGD